MSQTVDDSKRFSHCPPSQSKRRGPESLESSNRFSLFPAVPIYWLSVDVASHLKSGWPPSTNKKKVMPKSHCVVVETLDFVITILNKAPLQPAEISSSPPLCTPPMATPAYLPGIMVGGAAHSVVQCRRNVGLIAEENGVSLLR